MTNYTQKQIVDLARLAAADYAASCTGPTIRGLNGEKNLRGKSIEEVARNNGITVEEAEALTIDLATATFDEMSEHWQNVNIESAKGMIALLPAFGNGDPDRGAEVIKTVLTVPNFNIQAKYAAMLHEAWLKLPANSWAIGGDLDRPFDQLPPEEQAKDIQQLMSLHKWLVELEEPDVLDAAVIYGNAKVDSK